MCGSNCPLTCLGFNTKHLLIQQCSGSHCHWESASDCLYFEENSFNYAISCSIDNKFLFWWEMNHFIYLIQMPNTLVNGWQTLLRRWLIYQPILICPGSISITACVRQWTTTQCRGGSESGPPCGPPDRESASIIQWQISCIDFVLKGKAEIKCLSNLLPNQNCWNCKHCFVWMRDLSFFPGCMCPLTKKLAPTMAPILKLV